MTLKAVILIVILIVTVEFAFPPVQLFTVPVHCIPNDSLSLSPHTFLSFFLSFFQLTLAALVRSCIWKSSIYLSCLHSRIRTKRFIKHMRCFWTVSTHACSQPAFFAYSWCGVVWIISLISSSPWLWITTLIWFGWQGPARLSIVATNWFGVLWVWQALRRYVFGFRAVWILCPFSSCWQFAS